MQRHVLGSELYVHFRAAGSGNEQSRPAMVCVVKDHKVQPDDIASILLGVERGEEISDSLLTATRLRSQALSSTILRDVLTPPQHRLIAGDRSVR